MYHFWTPWKRQKTSGFLVFSGGTEMGHWLQMGQQQLYSEMIVEDFHFLIKILSCFNIDIKWILKLKLNPLTITAAYLKNKLYLVRHQKLALVVKRR